MKNALNTLILCSAMLAIGAAISQAPAIAQGMGSADGLVVKIQAPLTDRDSIVRKTDSTMATAMVDAIDTDFFTAANLDSTAEETVARQVMGIYVITSHHDNTTLVCADMINFQDSSTGADCDAKCAAAANWPGASLPTCDGSSTDASWILPGNKREYRVSGNQCLCYMAEDASQKAQVERIGR